MIERETCFRLELQLETKPNPAVGKDSCIPSLPLPIGNVACNQTESDMEDLVIAQEIGKVPCQSLSECSFLLLA